MTINFDDYFENKTIFALSTVFGRSAIAVVRVTGINALCVLDKFAIKIDIKPRFCHFVTLLDEKKNIIDHCILVYFKSPNSFTGEDIVELHLHGGRAVINLVLKKLSEIDGFFMAEPGDFSRRAFMNGKLDLLQAEGLFSVIHAETSEQLIQANRQLSGEATKIFDALRKKILQIFSNCEALLDFPEDDLEDDTKIKYNGLESKIYNWLLEIEYEISSYLHDGFGEKLASGFKISIVGEPNVGKSSLINHIAKKPIAIVSEIPGTTRDLVTVSLDIEGYYVEFIDTAGIRDTNDLIESIGISRARSTIEDSDLVLIISTAENLQSYKNFINEFDERKHILIANKMDEYKDQYIELEDKKYLAISIKEDKNLDIFFKKIKSFLVENSCNSSVITTKRQRMILEGLNIELKRLIKNFYNYQFLEILAEDIRNLAGYVSQLTGKIANDEILDELFSNFCIGK